MNARPRFDFALGLGLVVAALSLSAPTVAAPTVGERTTDAPAGATGERPRIVLVTNHADARIMPLLRAELESLGLEVVTVDKGPDEVVHRDLRQAARDAQAAAGFRVMVSQGTVDVWIFDRVTGKLVSREILIQRSPSKAEETNIVLRAVELLRVSLMELEAPHEVPGEVEPPPALEQLVGFPEEKNRFALELGGGVLAASPDLGPFPLLHVGANARLTERLEVGALARIGLGTSSISEPEGTASAMPLQAAITLRYAFTPAAALLTPSLSAGVGLLWLQLDAHATGSAPDRSHHAVSPMALLDARLRLRVTSHLGIWLGAGAGYVLRPAVLHFAEREVASFSHLLLAGVGGIEVSWP